MDAHDDIPPMRPVRQEDALPEPRWRSPRRILVNLGGLLVVWAFVFVATSVLHVPFAILFTVGVALTALAIALDVARWRRTRRPH